MSWSNRDGDIVHYSARTGKYLEPQAGTPSRQLLAMARKGLRLDLRAALREAVETRQPVVRERVAVEVDDRVQLIELTVEPLPSSEQRAAVPGRVRRSRAAAEPRGGRASSAAGQPRADVEQLERELRDTRERLQATIEEYETALEELKSGNEELVSVNEELQSTNEELETSKEELQSVNEELHTVNLELAGKVEELDRANADLRNLFDSTQIATVFLDRHLVIRSFTPAVTVDLQSDRRAIAVGRSPTSRTSSRTSTCAATSARCSTSASRSSARCACATASVFHLMRILPYRTADDADRRRADHLRRRHRGRRGRGAAAHAGRRS